MRRCAWASAELLMVRDAHRPTARAGKSRAGGIVQVKPGSGPGVVTELALEAMPGPS